VRRVQISGGLFGCVLAIYIHVSQALFVAAPLAKLCGPDAWLALLIGGGIGTLHGLLAIWVCTHYPGKGPAEIARSLLGKWAGSLFGLVYAVLLLRLFSFAVRYVLDFTYMILLPGTPGRVIVVLFAAVVLYGAWDGLEPIARVSFQTLVAILATFALLPLLQLRELRLLQVDPILYHGMGALLRAVVFTLPWFGQTLAVMSLVSHMKDPRQAYRWMILGGATGTLLIAGFVAQTVFVLGPDLPSRYLFPFWALLQLVSIAKIVERIEVIFVTVWISGMWVKSSFYLYAAAESVARSIGLKGYRGPAVLLAVAGVLLTQFWSSPIDVIQWEGTPVMIGTFIALEFGLPMLLAAAMVIRLQFRGQGQVQA
jgi:spore germination protein KB